MSTVSAPTAGAGRALAALVAVLLTGGVVPSAAHATLVYESVSDTASPRIHVAANDGTGAKLLTRGVEPDLSPDGARVAFFDKDKLSPTGGAVLTVGPTDAAAPQVRLTDSIRSEPSRRQLAWSPDSNSIATYAGDARDPTAISLVVISLVTGARTAVATGKRYFTGMSFSPDGSQLAYVTSMPNNYGSAVYRYDRTTRKTTRLTDDLEPRGPLWGPSAIVFSGTFKKSSPFRPELLSVSPTSRRLRRVTTKNPAAVAGVEPTMFSDDGTRLLIESGATVNPRTGAVRRLCRTPRFPRNPRFACQGLALSHDGRAVLMRRFSIDGGSQSDIITMPYVGGPALVIARKVSNADWDR